jgi:replicative DNA helicase
VLASVLLEPEVLGDLRLTVEDFYLEAHQVLYQTLQALASEDVPIDHRTVQARLEERKEFDRVGGAAFLYTLDSDLPDLGRAPVYADFLRERTRRRRLLTLAERLGQRVQTSDVTADELAGETRRALEDLESVEGGLQHLWGTDHLREVLADAQRRREQREETGEAVLGLRTGIPLLDGMLCGLSSGLYLLAGGPGVGKTTLALQIAAHVARQAPVVYVSFENSAASLVTKLLCARTEVKTTPRDVSRGFADLEALEEAAVDLRPILGRLGLVEGDGGLTVGWVRSLVRRALHQHEAERCLVVVDYLQLWAKTSRELRSLSDVRARVDALGGDLVNLARQLGSPVLALSSQSRAGGGYGGGRGGAALDSLKESGDLEYAADVAMFLTGVEDGSVSPPAVGLELTVGKNRHGPVGKVPLVFQPDRGVMREEGRA